MNYKKIHAVPGDYIVTQPNDVIFICYGNIWRRANPTEQEEINKDENGKE